LRKRQPPPPGPGRPKLTIDPEQVRALAFRGFPAEQIVYFLGCSPSSIRGRFAHAYEEGGLALNARLRMTMFELALEGNRRALLWQAKQRFATPHETEVAKPRRVKPSGPEGCGGSGGGGTRARAKPAWWRAKARKTPNISPQVTHNRMVIPRPPDRARTPARRPWRILELPL
jgi:hypothetical protein